MLMAGILLTHTSLAQQEGQDQEAITTPTTELEEVTVYGEREAKEFLNGFFNVSRVAHAAQAHRTMSDDGIESLTDAFTKETGLDVVSYPYIDGDSFWSKKLKRWAESAYLRDKKASFAYMSNELIFSQSTALEDDRYSLGVLLSTKSADDGNAPDAEAMAALTSEVFQNHFASKNYERPKDARTDIYNLLDEAFEKLPNRISFDSDMLALATVLRDNLRELERSIRIKVADEVSWSNVLARDYYLDPDEPAGGIYFVLDKEGYINLSEPRRSDLQALVTSPREVIQSLRLLRAIMVTLGLLGNIDIDWYPEYEHEGISYADLLIDQAESGEVTDDVTIALVEGLRHKIANKISSETLSKEELRLAVNVLFKIQTALRLVFGSDGLTSYPLDQFDPDELRLDPLKTLLIPPNAQRAELDRLRALYETNPETLSADELERFFHLLCQIDGDCRVFENLRTIRQDLEGENHPETNVPYVAKVIEYEGKIYRGVFPQFEYLFRLTLPEELYLSIDNDQFKYSTRLLKEAIKVNPELKEKFTEVQLQDIENEKRRITDLIWHHNENPGVMELVNRIIHENSRHTGGKKIWGGDR